MARDLRWFYLFRLLSTSYLFVPVMVFFPSSRGLDIVHVLALGSVYCATVIVSEVPTGALADRIGRRRAMMLGALIMVAACLTYYLAHSFGVFAIAEVLAALSMTLCSGADSAYLFDLLGDQGLGHEYPRREGTASTWHQGGQTLAYAAGGLLGAYDLALPYLVSAGVALLAFFVALSMRDDRHLARTSPRLPGVRERLTQMREAFRVVGRQRRLQWVIAYSAIVFVLLRATLYIYQPYLKQAGFGIAATGFIFAGVYALAAVVSHHANDLRQRVSSTTLLWWLGGTLVATFLILGALPSGPWAIGVLAIQAAANGLYSPLVKPLLNNEIDDSRRRATVLSVESMARRVAFGLFPPAIGQVMSGWGTSAGLTACGVFGLVCFLILARSSDGLFARAPSEPGGLPRLAPKPEQIQ